MMTLDLFIVLKQVQELEHPVAELIKSPGATSLFQQVRCIIAIYLVTTNLKINTYT